MINEPEVLKRLKDVFDELDNLYSSIEENTDYKAVLVDLPSITPTGQYVEASVVATPQPPNPKSAADYDIPGRADAVKRYHETKEFMIFAFNLDDLKDPDFTLRPLDLTGATINDHRGSGTEITMKDGTKIHLPQMITGLRGQRIDGIRYNGESTEPFKEFRTRYGVEL